MLERIFNLNENHTNVRQEVIAGITTIMTMAYVLATNPSILSATRMDAIAVFTATGLASFVGTIAMTLLANYQFALAPDMELNAFFAYTVVLKFIELQNAKIIVSNTSTGVSLYSFGENFRIHGITVVLTIIGIIITGLLVAKNIKGEYYYVSFQHV